MTLFRPGAPARADGWMCSGAATAQRLCAGPAGQTKGECNRVQVGIRVETLSNKLLLRHGCVLLKGVPLLAGFSFNVGELIPCTTHASRGDATPKEAPLEFGRCLP